MYLCHINDFSSEFSCLSQKVKVIMFLPAFLGKTIISSSLSVTSLTFDLKIKLKCGLQL